MTIKKTKQPKKSVGARGKVADPARAPGPVAYADLVRIVDLLRSTERFSEFRLKAGEIEIEVKRAPGSPAPAELAAATPVAVPAPVAFLPAQKPEAAPAADIASLPAGLELARAPSMGVFYRSPKPGAPPFVEPGTRVEAGSTIGLVEVMKLFSSVPAPCAGTVTHVLVADGAAIAEGQPLVAVRPGP